MNLTRAEKETVITLNDEDDTVHIYTCQAPFIRRLKQDARATMLTETPDSATFVVPKSQWTPWGGFKRKVDPAVAKAAGDRLRALHAAGQ